MKKILVIMTTLYNGGAERSLVNFLTTLPEDKYEIDLLLFKKEGLFLNQVPQWINIVDAPENMVKLYSPLSKAGYLAPWKIVANILCRFVSKNDRVQRYFRWKFFYSPFIPKLKKSYDVVLSYVSGEVMYFAKEKVHANKRFVWIHNDYRTAGHPKKYDTPYFDTMDGIITISDKCLDVLKEEFPQFIGKLYMMENITSSRVVKNRADEYEPAEYTNEYKKILSIGRLSHQKGFDFAIKALRLLKDSGDTSIRWYIIGNGELKDELHALAEKLDVSDLVCFLGVKENPYPYIKHCDIVAQTSRYEGKSVVIDEAKILCKPILATAYPTVKDQIDSMKTGVVVDMTPEAIAEGIQLLLSDKNLRSELSTNLSYEVCSNEDEVNKYMKVMDE